jgi:hypothetical protein
MPGASGASETARIAAVCSPSRALALRAFQHGPQRHTAVTVPSGRRSRMNRQPVELVSVIPSVDSGDIAPQVTQISRAFMASQCPRG